MRSRLRERSLWNPLSCFKPSFPSNSQRRVTIYATIQVSRCTSVFNVVYTKIKDINGLDCYLFVRFLQRMVRIMLPIWILSWAVLFPLTSIDLKVTSHAGLEKFIIGNVAPINRQSHYTGHLILT